MNYIEEKIDLFSLSDKYCLAHCISRDAKMGAGIAVQFVRNFPCLTTLRNRTNCYYTGSCVKMGRVFNLITKDKYYNKPTYLTLESSLISMKHHIERYQIKYLAMPKIGCGLDRLEWEEVRKIIINLYEDIDIEIRVCYL